MSVEVEITVKEHTGIVDSPKKIQVLSHWNHKECVVLKIAGKEYIFDGYDLIQAIKKAQRV